MSDAAEYLPTTSEKKPARFIPNNDDDGTRQILKLRWTVITDTRLSRSARLFFVLLLDLALNPMVNIFRGAIRISQTKIGEKLGGRVPAAGRTVRKWTTELETAGYIWTIEHPMPNAWPLLQYHIADLVPRGMNIEPVTEDGLWGNGIRREAPTSGKILPLRENGRFLKNTAPESFVDSQIPVAAAKNGLSHRQNFAAPTGQKGPLPPAEKDRSERQNIAADTGKKAPLATAKNGRAHRQPIADKIEGKTPIEGDLRGRAEKETGLAPQLEEWRKGLKGKYPRELDAIMAKLRKDRQKGEKLDQKLVWAKMVAVSEALYGPGSMPEEDPGQVRNNPRPVRKAPEPKQMTEAELLDSAREAIRLGSTFLTEGQREALKRAGEPATTKKQ